MWETMKGSEVRKEEIRVRPQRTSVENLLDNRDLGTRTPVEEPLGVFLWYGELCVFRSRTSDPGDDFDTSFGLMRSETCHCLCWLCRLR